MLITRLHISHTQINLIYVDKDITFEDGAKIDPKIPEEGEDSLDPNSSEVKEQPQPTCFFPSIFSL